MRQAPADHAIEVRRVGGEAARDYAEVFDGVPSQHDGKDAAVVAELAALGQARPWEYQPAGPWEQELVYRVGWMVARRQMLTIWRGRLEGPLARHWPEANQVLKPSSVTVLKILRHHGGPKASAADPEAAAPLARRGGAFLSPEKVEHLLAGARSSAGVRVGEWQRQMIRDRAPKASAAKEQADRAQRRSCGLAKGHAVLQAQGQVMGVPTACALRVSTGDPRKYHAAGADRKAMGLDLAERSSGTYQGESRPSQRGSARARRWPYFAVLRPVQECGVRPRYEAKKARDGVDARRVSVAVMREPALALYHVGVRDQESQARRLFGQIDKRRGRPAEPRSATERRSMAQEVSPEGCGSRARSGA